jgi:hypothetical protein
MTDGVPQFYGPWASDIEHEYNRAGAPERAKQILCSGSITAEQVTEMNEALLACLTDAGITSASINEYNLLRIDVPTGWSEGRTTTVETGCEESTGWQPIIMLYGGMRQNPNKGDSDQLFADCLVRVGLEPEGFSGKDVAAQYATGIAFPDISGDPRFDECLYNPLDLP